ncbi:MAG: hypothetical protein M5U31_16500, partial [Acidimicrobiia bacterium]|nr:hypothetical protein [Acidimicrobiia bacterium]
AQADLRSAEVTARGGAVHVTVIVVLAEAESWRYRRLRRSDRRKPVAVDFSAPFDVGMRYVCNAHRRQRSERRISPSRQWREAGRQARRARGRARA